MKTSIVIMGVAGCGKSSLAAAAAQVLRLPLVEGDEFHSDQSRSKMRQGVPLTDVDRFAWLDRLCDQLRAYPQGVVLTCSALKRVYRNRLREASPGLFFAFLDISRPAAQARVQARAQGHFFPTQLVDSQFATLESPVGEAGVLQLDATRPLSQLQAQLSAWLNVKENV